MKLFPAILLAVLSARVSAGELPVGSAETGGREAAIAKLLQQAQAAQTEGRASVSLALYRNILREDPGNRAAKYGIANSLILQNHTKEAQQVLEMLIKQFPEDYVLKNNASWLYATTTNTTLRNPQRAISLARDALMIKPNDYHVWSTLADAHYAAGDFPKAFRSAQRAVELVSQAEGAPDKSRYVKQLARVEKALVAFSLLE